jgi:hypothetical protein
MQATLQEIRAEEEELLQGGRDRRTTPFNWGQFTPLLHFTIVIIKQVQILLDDLGFFLVSEIFCNQYVD